MDTRRDRSDFSYEGFQYSGDFFRLANPVTIVIGTPLLDRVASTARNTVGAGIIAKMFWSHILNIAVVSYSLNILHNGVGNSSGLHIT